MWIGRWAHIMVGLRHVLSPFTTMTSMSLMLIPRQYRRSHCLCDTLNSMAAIRRIIGSNKISSPRSLLSFRRGIAFKLFVGGLSVYTTEKGLSDAFSNCGQVVEAKIITDRVSERSKGFGFVTFASQDEAENAISQMNGKALNGRVIFVDYAKPSSKTGGMPIARGPPEPTVDS